jgi:hypothetical protein
MREIYISFVFESRKFGVKDDLRVSYRMDLITPLSEFAQIKSRGLILIRCKVCGKEFNRIKSQVQKVLAGSTNIVFNSCSLSCAAKLRTKKRKVNCRHCNCPILKREKELSKNGFGFCNHSCSASYWNSHKTTGNRRSKLEEWLQIKLKELYPTLECHFNKTETINSELDIYFPSLKLAIELNGIFHYEPIYGDEKLGKIQNNDKRKFQACAEKGISLCVIDTSSQKKFKEENSYKFLKIITDLIEEKVGWYEENDSSPLPSQGRMHSHLHLYHH